MLSFFEYKVVLPCNVFCPVLPSDICARVQPPLTLHSRCLTAMPLHTRKDDKSRPVGCTRVLYRRLTVTAQDMARYRTLYNQIMTSQAKAKYSYPFSPVSSFILSNMPLSTYIPALLQCWTCCRFNELNQISIDHLRFGSPITIKSSKSSHTRVVPPFPFLRKYPLIGISPYTRILVTCYDSYREAILKTESKIGLHHGLNILDRTHIFRHLEASYMFEQGQPIGTISDHLGHLHDKTTRLYIHKNLFSHTKLKP